MSGKGENVVLAPVRTVGNAVATERDEGEFRFHDVCFVLCCFLIVDFGCVKIFWCRRKTIEFNRAHEVHQTG